MRADVSRLGDLRRSYTRALLCKGPATCTWHAACRRARKSVRWYSYEYWYYEQYVARDDDERSAAVLVLVRVQVLGVRVLVQSSCNE